jgi:three-Cys-motif partner protein
MAIKDLFDDPFDDGTLIKLEIFENYVEAWLPTFIMAKRKNIGIFDLFAGSGYDKNGVPGSPIRILKQINHQLTNILKNGTTIQLYLNAFDKDKGKSKRKYEQLKLACSEYIQSHPDLNRLVQIHYFNEDCAQLFIKLLPSIKANPALVFLDQNGIKFLADKYLLELEKLKETDFLYYVSSSYFWRLGETPEFKAHVDIDLQELKEYGYERVHRSVIKQLRRRLPVNTQLKLYPFSIKKEQNIFGIIFGATHPLAVDKFLDISWKRNTVNGEANFDIDGDTEVQQLALFGAPKLKKIDQFKANIRRLVLSGEISNNSELLDFTYSEGHIPTHAKETLMKMKADGEVRYDAKFPLVTYDNVYGKTPKSINYTPTISE